MNIEKCEALESFRNEIVSKFIDLCNGNDYNKLTLLKIGDTIDEIYERHISDIVKGGENNEL